MAISAPALATWKPSTSFSGAIASITLPEFMCPGKGNCTRMPCTAGSRFSALMRPSNSLSAMLAG